MAATRIVKIAATVVVIGLLVGICFAVLRIWNMLHERDVLQQVITRLNADSRIAEILVTDVHVDAASGKPVTTIKFLEYDTKNNPLEPRYFTFKGNLLQFQSLVIRFNDECVGHGDAVRGKSAYLFWKVFMLDGKDTQEYEITKMHTVPEGYRLRAEVSPAESVIWERFWEYALDPGKAQRIGIKNAQIEAPGTLFKPGSLYTVKIEHDGGMRIDVTPLPHIIRGEHIPSEERSVS